jgi:hypothetical protein
VIRAERRFAADVGGCRACDKLMHPLETDEVVCIRIGSLSFSQELRFCDDCLPLLLAESVMAQKAKAKRTTNGGMVGVEFAPRGDAVRTIPRKATKVKPVRALAPRVTTPVPRAYRARKAPVARVQQRAKAKRRRLTAWMTSDGTECVLVAARTRTEAARLMGRSFYSFKQYASDLRDDHVDAAMALAAPGVVFTCSNRGPKRDWKTA